VEGGKWEGKRPLGEEIRACPKNIFLKPKTGPPLTQNPGLSTGAIQDIVKYRDGNPAGHKAIGTDDACGINTKRLP
jgi:hypothetical protein